MDLSRAYPRSPKEKMAGLVQLARMIDKARAFRENMMADYIYPCPLDKIILNFLRIDSDEFAIRAMDFGDDEISAWSQEILKDKNSTEIDFINDQILERRPDSEDRLKYFHEIRNRIDPSREDINTWVDLLDLEEGRLPPK
jgi:hypothetical protein